MTWRPRGKEGTARSGGDVFKKIGGARIDFRDPYHLAIALTWPEFFTACFMLYLAVNLAFAVLFWFAPGSVAHAQPRSFGDCFFFSIETLSTVGFGEMYPATSYGRVVTAAELVCGLAFTAILTGLTFVRFSRPQAKMVFAAHPVVAVHDGKPTLMLRVVNGRSYGLLRAKATLSLLTSETAKDGKHYRRVRELRLERSHLPFFQLAWTLMHVLDDRSPLYGYDAVRVAAAKAHLLVTMEACDPTLSATVQDFRGYGPGEIRFGVRYVDAVMAAEDGTLLLDLTRLEEFEPEDGTDHLETGWTERE
jgi:inward rectifier potassium channel